MSWIHAVRARLRLLVPRAAESRMDDEIRFHIEMETERLMREQGLDAGEARRRALVTFGGVQQHRETLREGRGTAWLGGLSLDLKLGVRMLRKYPGLALVGVLAMAFGIWFGAVTFQMFGLLTTTALPLPDGDRIVRIVNRDLKLAADEKRVLYDYQLWRSARSITDLGAYRDASINLRGADGSAQAAVAAEITESAFRIAPQPPLLGRVLAESDARAGAAPVVLLGHEVWSRRFASDPGIVGRTVQLGSGFATVVGVMPEGFAFPESHELWLPLRTAAPLVESRRGPPVTVFARLAGNATLAGAQAEVAALSQRIAAEHPATHGQIRTYVLPYTQTSVDGGDFPIVRALTYLFVVVLVMVVCSTVALLLFARAAARENEILVRSALGASRQRIVAQLFAEALVLAGVAAVVGLVAAQLALTRWGRPYLEMNIGRLPFWYDLDLSPTVIAYALGLALMGAAVAGVMPARKITRGLGTRLRAGTAGGGGASFGGVWTAVIVTQVALTVMLPAVVLLVRGESARVSAFDPGFSHREYLGVALGLDAAGDSEAGAPVAESRFTTSLETLRQRVEGEAGVASVTFVDRLPGRGHPYRRAEMVSLPGTPASWVSVASIDPSYFEVLRVPVLSGRAFTSADLGSDDRVAIVDENFTREVMEGRNPLGHRMRLVASQSADSTAAPGPWHEIVGVVESLGMGSPVERNVPAGVYLPTVPGSEGSLSMIVHGRGDPLALAPRIRELALAVDPAIRVDETVRLDQVASPLLWFLGLWIRILLGLAGVALLLSLSGIYAVLAYTVARRTREIGVRVALGAGARRVILSIFRRPLTQVILGVAAGSTLIGVAAFALQYTYAFSGVTPPGSVVGNVALLLGYAALMLGICALACIVPTLRALRVQPTEALRAE